MASPYSPLLGLSLPTTGTLSGVWGDEINGYITSYLESAVAGSLAITADKTLTLTTNPTALGATSSQYAILLCNPASANITVTAPATSKTYVIVNASATYTVKIVGAGSTTGVTLPVSSKALVVCSGTDFVLVASSLVALGSITGLGTGVATALAVNVGSAGAPVVNGGALGTPSSGVGTNITNVNAATLGGATFAAPGAIGGGTAAAGSFTTLSASTAAETTVTIVSTQTSGRSWTFNTAGTSYGSGAGSFALRNNGSDALVFNASSVASIPNGLNSTVIGATTPAEGSFTTLSASGAIATFGSNSAQVIALLNSSAAQFSSLQFQTAGAARWALEKSGSETGSNAGGDLNLYRYTDAGSYLGNPLTINRATGLVTANTGLAVTGLLDLSSASAGQIKFPATQNASADANTLDDYEEGTWTPAQGAGLTVVGAFSSAGRYTKVGRLVTVNFSVSGATSVAVTTGTEITSNLPFTTSGVLPVGAASNANPNGSAIVIGSVTSVYPAATIAATLQILVTITYITT